MFQVQNQSIRPLTTAHLAQTMALLAMTGQELQQKIESELGQNPALELIEDRHCPTCQRSISNRGPCPICSRRQSATSEEPIVFVSSSESFGGSNFGQSSEAADDLPDDNLAPVENLPTYVLRQIASELEPSERPIAAHILSSLNDDGLLQSPLYEISRYHHVPISKVEKVIGIIQKADPVGVGSATTEEALLVQLEVLQDRKKPVPALAKRIIAEGMTSLSRHKYKELGKELGASTQEIKEIAQFIATNLNPFPARAHWGNIHQGNNSQPPTYQKPDILIRQLELYPEAPLVVEILIPMRGTLRINPLFRQTLKDAPADSIDKWKADLESANLIIKCLQQRNNTMQRLMAYLAKHQREFILKGKKYLKPTTRAKIAVYLEVHESTISRAVSGKCVQLPNGQIIPLKQMFDPSLHIRAHLLEIIQKENAILTDTQLASLLSQKGFKIARRTVAKYRAMEGVLPAHMRRNLIHNG